MPQAQAQPFEKPLQASTVDAEDVARFSRIAAEWWDPKGKFKPLHDLNPARITYLRDTIAGHFGLTPNSAGWHAAKRGKMNGEARGGGDAQALQLLDVGCGGGLISEPMARLGAQVTGIDASAQNISVASLHAQQAGLGIDYRATTAEDLAASGVQFDIVLALEIVEHVADVGLFLRSLTALVKPGGLLIMSTLNRTKKSYLMAIIGAEYVLRLLPRGTHSWKQFIRPSELTRACTACGLDVKELKGLVLDPRRWQWGLSEHDLDVNYLLAATKPAV